MRPVGIVGLGIVGGTLASALEATGVAVRGYDKYRPAGAPEDLAGCEVVFVCVPTPRSDDGGHDLTEVWAAVGAVAPHLDEGAIVGVRSTVPPGTCAQLQPAFPRLRIASVPEFLVATNPLETLVNPDRIVIGATGEAAASIAALLGPLAPAAPVIVVPPTHAELIKLASNAMLAAKVTMANELAEVCRRFGVAWDEVRGAVAADHRIGTSHLEVTAERGFGGACLPKDLDGLIAAALGTGYTAPLLRAIGEFNRRIRADAARAGNGRRTMEGAR